MAKLPSFQFYPGDWMKDPALRSCSVAARGLWMDLLCLMFESDRRGYLQAPTGKPYSHEQIARMTGCSPDEVSCLLEELSTSGVYSRTAHGVIFSRRIKRDEELRAEHRNRQNKYRNSKKTQENSDAPVDGPVTQVSQHTSSSSSSSSSIQKTTPINPLPDWIEKDAWEGFVEMRNRKKWTLTERGRQGIIRELDKLRLSGQDPNACLDQSTTRCYRGVFPVNSGSLFPGNGKIAPHPDRYKRDPIA